MNVIALIQYYDFKLNSVQVFQMLYCKLNHFFLETFSKTMWMPSFSSWSSRAWEFIYNRW